MKKTGILAAMHEEVAHLISAMQADPAYACHRTGMRDYHVGSVAGQPCVVVLARLGKVAAAASAVTLIREFGVDEIVFTGLAGGLASSSRVGDVVIASSLVQHDLDVRPFFPRYEVPLLGIAEFHTNVRLRAELEAAASTFFSADFTVQIPPATAAGFGIGAPRLHTGLILSGDQFIGAADEVTALLTQFPLALAVEMEGAAVAQVCHEHAVPCAVLRTISDRADENAHVDFGRFLSGIASIYSDGILRRFLLARNTRSSQSTI